MALDRQDNALILGSRVYIAVIGQKGTTSKQPIDDVSIPEDPTSYKEPGDWTCLGKIRSLKPQTDYKTADVEGVDDTGAYKVTELKISAKRKIQFSTNDITPEAIQLTYGLLNPVYDGEAEQPVFASGSDQIDVWMFIELTDAYRTKTGLVNITLRGKLGMQNPLEAKSDPALAEYELSVVPNSLAMFEAKALGETKPKPAE